MKPLNQLQSSITRRNFFGKMAQGVGLAALGSLLNPDLLTSREVEFAHGSNGMGIPHFAPKAKRIIYLFQNGAPSHLDLFD